MKKKTIKAPYSELERGKWYEHRYTHIRKWSECFVQEFQGETAVSFSLHRLPVKVGELGDNSVFRLMKDQNL